MNETKTKKETQKITDGINNFVKTQKEIIDGIDDFINDPVKQSYVCELPGQNVLHVFFHKGEMGYDTLTFLVNNAVNGKYLHVAACEAYDVQAVSDAVENVYERFVSGDPENSGEALTVRSLLGKFTGENNIKIYTSKDSFDAFRFSKESVIEEFGSCPVVKWDISSNNLITITIE